MLPFLKNALFTIVVPGTIGVIIPFYVGVLLIVLGWTVYFASVGVPVYGVCLALGFHLFVILVEEPSLRRRFGESYEHYCRVVRRWVPGRRYVPAVIVILFAGSVVVACGGGSKSTTDPTPVPTPTAPSPPIEDANAILARCPTPEEVAAADRDLVLSFDYDVTAGRTVCSAAQSSRDLTLLQAQTYRVLTVMRRLTFGMSLPWTSNSLYGWMVSSIRGIRFRGDDIANSFCCAPANTIDIKATLGPNNSGLAALVFPTDFRAVGTLMVLFVHEARHNNGFPHTCPDRINDKTIAELGAWGVQYYTDLFLANQSDPALIAASARTGFMQDAQNVCATRFCEDHCP